MDKMFFQFGPLTLAIIGDKDFVQSLSKDFETGVPCTDPDIEFYLLSHTDQFPEYEYEFFVGKGVLAFGKSTIFYGGYSSFEMVLENVTTEKVTRCYFRPKKEGFSLKLNRLVKRALGVEYTNKFDFYRLELANYSYIWLVLALTLLKRDECFVHAGLCESHGRTIMIAGTGGCGKTSLILELVEKHGFNYLAEDFGVISKNGAYFSPKTVSLYYSDILHGNTIALKSVKDLRYQKRVKWLFLTKILKRNPIMKIEPRKLFNCVGKQSKISHAFFLIRKSVEEISIENISTEEFAKRTFHASFRELKLMNEIENLCKANDKKFQTLPSRDFIEKKYLKSIMCALNQAEIFCVTLPKSVAPYVVSKKLIEIYERRL